MDEYSVIHSGCEESTTEIFPAVNEVVIRAQQGDSEAFTLLYQEYVRPVYRYIFVRVSNRHEQAEDLTQEVFLKALKNIRNYRYRGKPFSSWLFRIAHNTVIDYYRHAKKAGTIPLTETMMATLADEVDGWIEEENIKVDVKTIIEKLPAQQREVISLRFGSGLSVADTAAAIGKTQGTVKKLQHVALEKLKNYLKNE